MKACDNKEKDTGRKKDVATALADFLTHDSKFTTGGNIVMNFDNEPARNEAAERLKTVDRVISNVKRI